MSKPGVMRLHREIKRKSLPGGPGRVQRIARVREFGRTKVKTGRWYRSKNGRSWHKVDGDGNARCGVPFVRTQGPLLKRDLRVGAACPDCA